MTGEPERPLSGCLQTEITPPQSKHSNTEQKSKVEFDGMARESIR